MSDLAVAGLDEIPGDGGGAAKMGIVRFSARIVDFLYALHRFCRHWAAHVTGPDTHGANAGRTTPIRSPAVVIVNIALHLPRHGPIGVDIGTVVDLLPGQSYLEFTADVIDVSQGT